MASESDFCDYCCELLAAVGPCTARRMFGGWGISTDGLGFAIVADLGSGETLWLKADAATRQQFEEAGCMRFTYAMRRNGVTAARSMNFYSAPEDAMDSPPAMEPWARMALASALKARQAKGGVSKPAAERKGTRAATTSKPDKSVKSAAKAAARPRTQG